MVEPFASMRVDDAIKFRSNESVVPPPVPDAEVVMLVSADTGSPLNVPDTRSLSLPRHDVLLYEKLTDSPFSSISPDVSALLAAIQSEFALSFMSPDIG
ncbi:Uncharacterised protein [BD1-7 clade bacterium]|uniref:Uncharacterized protein n=1 Tax=BD1-7 clade bacterium TaxID=2029982 RepID=A0A5S9QKX9_9GAMM|nr:Uncharacterised protein [BD1-7 clade bacterium]